MTLGRLLAASSRIVEAHLVEPAQAINVVEVVLRQAIRSVLGESWTSVKRAQDMGVALGITIPFRLLLGAHPQVGNS